MATLEILRKRAGTLVAVVIGLSLIAFILGDFLNSGSGGNRNSLVVGEVNGNNIMYAEFNERVDASVENYKRNSRMTEVDAGTYSSIRSQVWNSFLTQFLYEDIYEDLGVSVGEQELWDMVQGKNIHPQIQAIEIFKNEVTQEFDRNKVIQFLKNMENDPAGQAYPAWLELENELQRDRTYTKYQNLLAKGLYVTKWQVDYEFAEANYKYDMQYVSERYQLVPDSLVTVTEADVENFYEENKDRFTQESSRDVNYVSWDVVPSEADHELVRTWITEQLPEFKRIENAQQYMKINGDSDFNPYYLPFDKLDNEIREWIQTADVDSVYGPYKVGDFWKIAKITDIKTMPDSVRASHILIRPDAATGSFDPAQVTADSLKTLIENGASFEELALEYGTDDTAADGGDIDWFSQEMMIPDFALACFTAKKNELFTVRTVNGIHLVKVTDQKLPAGKKYQVAFLDREITASSQTIQAAWDEASRFASTYNSGEKFEEGVVTENLAKRLADNLRADATSVAGLENPREMVRWAFTADEGDLSPIYEFGNRFILAKVNVVREEGIAPLDRVYGEVESLVRNEKKIDYLEEHFVEVMEEGANTLEEIAAKLNLEVKTTVDQYFTANSITGIGIEPKLSAALVSQPLNTVSKPIRGNNGVYVVMITAKKDPGPDADIIAARNRIEQNYSSRTGYAVFQAVEENAKIVDRRNEFY